MMVRTTMVDLGSGASMAVEAEGKDPPILFLHAGVSERHMWDPQWEWLQERMRVLRFDWRGFGQDSFSYAHDVERVMDTFEMGVATLMACSFGGAWR